ncbi:MAG: hypothetical protein QCH96_04730 [Candidatus Thermoplasmatota archaeon]|nr:hypothetical protein [Candidatus Thermoplasmatota archaeon]
MNSIILLIVGLILVGIGSVSLLNPNLARWINLPGDPRLKASVSIIIGTIIININFTL